MNHIQTTEKFIQTVFGTFVSILVTVAMTGIYGSILLNPVVFTVVILSLIGMGYTTWYLSELQLQTKPSVASFPEISEPKQNGILAETMLAFSVGFGAFIYQDHALMYAITSNWLFAVCLVSGMILFYASAYALFHCAFFWSESEASRTENQQALEGMKRYLNNFIQELLLTVPLLFLGSFLINSAVVMLVATHIWVFLTIVSAGVIALSSIHASDNNHATTVLREGHKNTFFFRLNVESKKLIARLTVGIFLTLLAGVLLVNASFIAAHSWIALGAIAVIVFTSEIYLLISKFKSMKDKSVISDLSASIVPHHHSAHSQSLGVVQTVASVPQDIGELSEVKTHTENTTDRPVTFTHHLTPHQSYEPK